MPTSPPPPCCTQPHRLSSPASPSLPAICACPKKLPRSCTHPKKLLHPGPPCSHSTMGATASETTGSLAS